MARIERVTTSHWGAFRLTAEDGRLVAAEPFADDPDPSDICRAVPAAVHHPSRIARPSIRRGWLENPGHRAREKRGRDEFVELPWDEALDIAAQEIDRVRREHGSGAIYGGSYGWSSAGRFHHAQSQVHRFLNSAGGYVASFASYSTGCAQSIMPHVIGRNFLEFSYGEQTTWNQIARETETLVMFGGIGRKNAQVSMGGVTRHEVGPWLEQMRGRGRADGQHLAPAERRLGGVRVVGAAAGHGHRADAGAGLCAGGGGADGPRVPRPAAPRGGSGSAPT